MAANVMHALVQLTIIWLLFGLYRRARGNYCRVVLLLVAAALNATVLGMVLVDIWEAL